MKINDVLESFNEALRQHRMSKGYDNVGEFMFYQYYDKKLGNYYEYHMKIQYIVNHVNITNFVSLDKTIQIKDGPEEREKAIDTLHQAILTSFMTKLLEVEIYDSLVNGSYGT